MATDSAGSARALALPSIMMLRQRLRNILIALSTRAAFWIDRCKSQPIRLRSSAKHFGLFRRICTQLLDGTLIALWRFVPANLFAMLPKQQMRMGNGFGL